MNIAKSIASFYRKAPASPEEPSSSDSEFRRLRWSVFVSATLGYGTYYVCRLSLSVVKKPLVDGGLLSESELGVIGSCLFFAYAIGKLTNGFLSDRCNVPRMMATGLLLSALANIAFGFSYEVLAFSILWALNGWFQSMGAAPSVVSLSRWYSDRDRGTYYGLWSSSHNIGEAITFIAVALVVGVWGWRYGFVAAGSIGLLFSVVIWKFLHDSPASKGMDPRSFGLPDSRPGESVSKHQLGVLKSPAIWILAAASACMYVSRYAIGSWGIFYLENAKGYSSLEASSVVSVSSVFGILGTVSCGFVSDRFFGSRRNVPALLFGLLCVGSLALFFFGPPELGWLDSVSMILFGLAIGALICYLGGLMAVDIASKKASGAALGLVGVASYAGAGLQDIVSGKLIENGKRVVDGAAVYDFGPAISFWVGASALSVVLALLVWKRS